MADEPRPTGAIPSEPAPTYRIGNAPVAGFGIRFSVNGPDSPYVAWCQDEVIATGLAALHVAHRPLILPATITFE